MNNSSTTTFGHSDPSWRVELDLPAESISPEMVKAGDIVFTRRPKGYQRLAAVAGDTWRHVGIIGTIAGFPWIIEVGPHGYMGRPFTSVIECYDTIAIQRLLPCKHHCSQHLLNHVAYQMNFPKTFHTKTELGSIGLSSLLRLRWFQTPMWKTASALVQRFLSNREGLNDRATCATPLADVLREVCDDHAVCIDLLGPKDAAPDPRMHAAGLVNLAMPDDIWRSLQKTSTSRWVKKDEITFVTEPDLTIDLRKEVTA